MNKCHKFRIRSQLSRAYIFLRVASQRNKLLSQRPAMLGEQVLGHLVSPFFAGFLAHSSGESLTAVAKVEDATTHSITPVQLLG